MMTARQIANDLVAEFCEQDLIQADDDAKRNKVTDLLEKALVSHGQDRYRVGHGEGYDEGYDDGYDEGYENNWDGDGLP